MDVAEKGHSNEIMDINEKKTGEMIKIFNVNEIDAIKPREAQAEKDEKMVSDIEKEQATHKDDVELEYFVDGKRKFYVPSHHNFKIPDDVIMLQAENMILRLDIKRGMARKINELEKKEFWMTSEILTLKGKNDKLEDYIKKLEEKLRKCNCK